MPYDSFLDRTPKGPVVVNTPVTWRLTAPEARVVTLLLSAPDQSMHAVVMTASANGWTATFEPPQVGAWYYAFRLETDTGQMTLAAVAGGFGGRAQRYHDPNTAPWYQLSVVAKLETVPTWYQDARIYHIFVDRFNNGNADGHVNAPKPNSFLYGQLSDQPYYVKDAAGEVVRWDFYGGNLQGIIAKLDWLLQQGFTALYLSPIFEARSNHRYDTGDYLKIDPMLGTLADFQALVSGLHERGMHLILDGVFNHVGRDSRYFNALGTYAEVGAAQSQDSPYADWFAFKHFPDDYDSWWGVKDLPAIRKASQSFHDFIAGGPDSVIGYWTALGVDGWRLDVVDELDIAFVDQIRALLATYPDRVLIGEVWEDASHKVAYGKRRPYFDGAQLQAVMNYPQRQLLLDYVQGQLTPAQLGRRLLTLQENYPPQVFAYNFTSLSTHDTARVLTVLDHDLAKLKQALMLWAVLPGNLVQFYGDEAGLDGGPDPQNRKYYPWEHVDAAVSALYQQLGQWRQLPALAGAVGFAPFWDGDLFGVVRFTQAQVVVAVFNAGEQAATLDPASADLRYVPAWLHSAVRPLTVAAHDCTLAVR
ncbi:alpha-amylase family glycosyl hydrolase [Lacticaseibacillus baoqingensis]|uniref:Alpha-amylase family glycosyl hydrolase n=1 Tax=Lacticaseibacillus baoqingensis TaxID=2486013 RepID=A0ABW4E5X5_9LACO|nr:alpha-amylase family glycosyl hydrolase [Lacticaseibacillus baoqingensis]